MLKLTNITKEVSGKLLVEDISFEVNRGEIFGFLGPNGAGKTTTIKMITGLYNPTRGTISINGFDVKKDFEKAMEHVGSIIENPEMYASLSGYDNLCIYSRMHKGITKERINEVITLVKLENRINDKVKTYSLGMRQRLGIAQALLHKPSLLILDEPTNGLDPVGIKELRELLRKLTRDNNIAVIVSSHLLNEMELMCDRFGIIDAGKIIGIKTLGEIKNKNANIQTKYKFETTNNAHAVQLLKEKGLDVYVNTEDNSTIIVNCKKETIPTINKFLMSNNIDVLAMSAVEEKLESEFMKITSGSKTQIR